eukprot:1160581-Rhodomonas_salina.2
MAMLIMTLSSATSCAPALQHSSSVTVQCAEDRMEERSGPRSLARRWSSRRKRDLWRSTPSRPLLGCVAGGRWWPLSERAAVRAANQSAVSGPRAPALAVWGAGELSLAACRAAWASLQAQANSQQPCPAQQPAMRQRPPGSRCAAPHLLRPPPQRRCHAGSGHCGQCCRSPR